jgi:hypothetical protein
MNIRAKWSAKTPVEKSYVYIKLLFLQGTFGFAIIWELYPLMRTT